MLTRFLFSLVALVLCIEGGAYCSRVQAAQDPTTGSLVQPANFAYEGAFRLPSGPDDCHRFDYGGSVLAFDSWRQSIWAIGHDQCQAIAEITVPTPVNGTLGSLPRAALKGAWIQTPWRNQVMGGTVKIGGILPQANGDLIISAYAFYDSNNAQVTSHFRRAANGTVTGPFRIDTPKHTVNPNKAGAVSGYMFAIPAAWRTLFGGPAMTGNCCLSIIARTSLGPALTVFDPAQVGSANPIPSTEVLGYPITHPTLGETPSTFNPTATPPVIYNGSVNNSFAKMTWIEGTRTLLAIQKIGVGQVTYNAGYSAGQDILYAIAYDANDLLAVKNGTKLAYQVLPYAHWFFDIGPIIKALGVPGPLTVNTDEQGITYDPVTRRLFMSFHTGQSGGEHIVGVWRVNAPPPPPPPPADTIPPSVTVTASPLQVTTGGEVALAADALDNVAVTNVVFAVNGQPVSTDQSVPYQGAFTPTVAGSYQVTATAYDAAGLSASASVTVTATDPLPPPPPPPPPDTDGDGVPDATDACPTVSGTEPNGCPPPPPPTPIAAPTVTLRSCSTYIEAAKPAAATGTGWKVQYFNGATALTTSSTTIRRSVTLLPGTYSAITARWTLSAQTLTSAATAFVCDGR